MVINKLQPAFLFNYLITIIFIVWCITPILQRNIHPLLLLIIVIIWFVSVVLLGYKFKLKIKPIILAVVCFITILIMQYFRVRPVTSLGNLLTAILAFYPIFIFYYIRKNTKYNIDVLKGILGLIILVTAFNAVHNIFLLIGDPTASKYLGGSVEIAMTTYQITNVATPPFVAFTILLFPIFWYYFENRKGFQKLFYLLIALVTIIFAYLAASSLALIALSIEIVMLLVFKIKNGYNRLFLVMFIIGLLLLTIIAREPLGQMLVSLSYDVDNYFYSQRIGEVGHAMMGISHEGSFSARMQDTYISIKSFMRSPLWGVGFYFSQNINQTGIGMHSQIIDDLARYGLIGFGLLGYIYYSWIKNNFYLAKSREINRIVTSILIAIVFLALFNMFSNVVYGLLIFFVIPLFVYTNSYEEIEINCIQE